jgi:threonine/homoserine/homoserine lactone efflux protein
MIDAIITGLLLGMMLVLSVGPVVFTIIKLRINYGLASAFWFIIGVWLSDLVWVVTANAFSGLFEDIIFYKKPIGIAGGILLMALGIYYLFIRKHKPKPDAENSIKISNATHAGLFITGFLINTLNPGVITLWFAAATKSLSNTFDERLVIFSICLMLNMSADVLKINLAGRLRSKLTDKNINILSRFSGLMYLIFGVLLIIGASFSKAS